MTGRAVSWRDPAAADRCTAAVAAVTRDIFTWHRRGVTVRMVEPSGEEGVRLGVSGAITVREAQQLLAGVNADVQKAGAAMKAEDYMAAQPALSGVKERIQRVLALLDQPQPSQSSRRPQ